MKTLVDENWQRAATDNAAKGLPWAVWLFRTDKDEPGTLYDSFKTEERANEVAEGLKPRARPKGVYNIIVCRELPAP